ncbi:MAG: type I pullulanase [Saprospiraceae bacterium]|nr:type I pullulanase [Saprospiraceae bacterium]
MQMKLFFPLGVLLFLVTACQTPAMLYQSFAEYPIYTGDDLGLTYSPNESQFRVWSPSAEAVQLHIYDHDLDGKPIRTVALDPSESGTWYVKLKGDLAGKYYAFQTQQKGVWLQEVADPYVRAVGANGKRGQVINLDATDPTGWAGDRRPALRAPTDMIIYEVHVRDFSIAETSGMQNRGKFLAFTEKSTVGTAGQSTGLDHLSEMGITHVHLLPSFDFKSIDETALEEGKYNWGYDPQHYNVPEGSYATNPHDGAARITEFKQLVQALHRRGIRVILDVVYNHTGYTETSNLNQLVPGYYYRQTDSGGFSNASGCGNETASDRAMMRKLIVESVAYWAEEYHLDGFRFDLMGIHDQETMREVAQTLHRIDPSIFVYGEGWTAGESPLPDHDRALKKYIHQMAGVAAFSDDLRDAIKGHVFTHDQPGFVSGKKGLTESIKFGVVASTFHPQVDYSAVNYSDSAWAEVPAQTINYASCHDNHTLWDRLELSRPDVPLDQRIKMHRLALTIVLTAQGVPFLHAGTEFLRTKDGIENSYESPDAINQIDWSRKDEHKETVEYVKGLIRLRKEHPAFRLQSAADIRQHLTFLETESDHVVAFRLFGRSVGDPWEHIVVAYNGGDTLALQTLPAGEWMQVLNGNQVKLSGIQRVRGQRIQLPPNTAGVLYALSLESRD